MCDRAEPATATAVQAGPWPTSIKCWQGDLMEIPCDPGGSAAATLRCVGWVDPHTGRVYTPGEPRCSDGVPLFIDPRDP